MTGGMDEGRVPEGGPRVRLLGRPELRVGAAPVRLERRAAAALAYVLLSGETPKRTLAALLWPQTQGPQLLNNLRQLLRRLRLAGGVALLAPGEGPDSLAPAPGLVTDLGALRRSGGAARRAEDVLALQGELLAGLSFDDLPEYAAWLEGTRVGVAARQRALLETELVARERAGDAAGALQLAEVWLGAVPEADAAVQAVMRLHHALGSRHAALDAYARHRDFLAREVDATPSPETAALARRVRAGALAAVTPVPREPAAAPPAALSALERPPLQGRAAAWEQLARAARAGAPLLCVSGPPGTGRTRLAADFADATGPSRWVRGQPGDAGLGFATLARALRAQLPVLEAPGGLPAWARAELAQLLPELPVPAGPRRPRADAPRLRRLHAVAQALDALARGAALLVAEDLHAWDRESREALGYWLSDAGGARRPPVLATWCGPGPAELALALEADVAARAAWVELGPLARADVEALARALPDVGPARALADAAWRAGGGNPRLVVEALRAQLQGGGVAERARLRALARTLLARVHPRAPALVQLAVAPLALPWPEVEATAEALHCPVLEVVDALGRLRRAGLLTGPGREGLCQLAALAADGEPRPALLPVEPGPRLAAGWG